MENSGIFSDGLMSELKKILESKFNIKLSRLELQDVGRHIAQFVVASRKKFRIRLEHRFFSLPPE